MKTLDQFPRLLDALVELNQAHRHEMVKPDARRAYAPAQYAEWFCTVSCDIGRMAGKTEYIKRHASDGCLVVVPNDAFAAALYGRKTPFTVCSARQVQRIAAKSRFHTVYVDEPGSVFRAIDREKFYHCLAVDGMEQTFVLLGAAC